MLHNGKYYRKSLKQNNVESKNIASLFKKVAQQNEENLLVSDGDVNQYYQIGVAHSPIPSLVPHQSSLVCEDKVKELLVLAFFLR